jgi:hypothetical protein
MKQNYSHNYGFEALEKHISQILKPVVINKRDNFLAISNLNKNWQKIIGGKCWRFCYARKIQFSKNKKSNAILTIAVHNGAVAFYLEANASDIIENIASYYGYRIVSEIKIIQEPANLAEQPKMITKNINPKQQAFITQSTAIIKDDGLRLALQQLGNSILK